MSRLACVGLAVASLATRANAACDVTPNPGLIDGPVAIGLYQADLATGRRACPRTEVGLGARAGAVIAPGAFYGNLAVDTMVTGSWAWRGQLELFGALELLHWQFVQNASLTGTALELGQLTLGVASVALETPRWALTPYLRLMLPTASDGARVLGGELGVAASFRPHRRVELRGFVASDLSGAASSAPRLVRGGATLALGAQYMPWSWLGLALDLQSQLAHRGGFDTFALAPAARFRFWRGLGAELAALAPLAGAERHDFFLLLRLTNRF
jgi:hypothetical protein